MADPGGQPAAGSPPPAGAVPYGAAPFGAAPYPAASGPVYLLAGWGARAKAYVLDFAILLVPLLAVWAMLVPGVIDRASRDRVLERELDVAFDPDTEEFPIGRLLLWTLAVLAVVTLVYWLFIGIYSAVFMSRTAGQTPGRKLVGIRVMRADGAPITFWWALYRTLLVREILFGAGALLSGGLLHLAQYLWPLWDPGRRTLHDMVTRSRVVIDAGPDR